MRIRGRMIYCSSPDRGLDVLLNCMPKIKEQVPEANLRVFYGFKNWESAVLTRNNPQEVAWMKAIKDQLTQPGITYLGRIGQKQLAEEFKQAELWGYPTYFTETFCLSACEAMAAGVPIVTTNLAALTTTVGDAGILLDGDSHTAEYQKIFIQKCIQVLTDKSLWDDLSRRGLQKVKQYDWPNVANQWLQMLK